tara:strand:+ start:7200 stop:7754 length:555 start_codon:yes stop_codon:yes gene_type:complete
MIFSRVWAMPNAETFTIKPIAHLLRRELLGAWPHTAAIWVDPFVRNSNVKHLMTWTNDINSEFDADYNMEALEFLRLIDDESVDGVLFDPPYSVRQIKECYDGIGREITQYDTQNPWTAYKAEIARIVKPNGKVIRFGWSSGGIGKTLGFDLVEVMLVPHGGVRNDTIVTVEHKRSDIQGVLNL